MKYIILAVYGSVYKYSSSAELHYKVSFLGDMGLYPRTQGQVIRMYVHKVN